MTAAILKFPIQGDQKPGLDDMCAILLKNYAVLDATDKSFFALIYRVHKAGNRAKIETVEECRAIAWSMLNRYGLGMDL